MTQCKSFMCYISAQFLRNLSMKEGGAVTRKFGSISGFGGFCNKACYA